MRNISSEWRMYGMMPCLVFQLPCFSLVGDGHFRCPHARCTLNARRVVAVATVAAETSLLQFACGVLQQFISNFHLPLSHYVVEREVWSLYRATSPATRARIIR